MHDLTAIRRDVAARKGALRAPVDMRQRAASLDAAVRFALPISVGLALGAIAMRRSKSLRKAAPFAASAGVVIGRRVADEAIRLAVQALAPNDRMAR